MRSTPGRSGTNTGEVAEIVSLPSNLSVLSQGRTVVPGLGF